MGSIAAKEVAKEVLETVGKGKRPNLGKIIVKKGYAKNTGDSPKQVTNTKSYKEVMDPFVNKMVRERERIIEALSTKNLTKEKYRDMMDGLDKLTKNIQLLTGGDTGKEKISFTWE